MIVQRGVVSPEMSGWLAIFCCIPFLLFIPVTNDSAWQMWLGRQMLHGANLYSDLVEVNPPLWFWMAVPLAWIAEMLALPGRVVLIGFLVLTIALSYGLSIALIRDWPPHKRLAFTAGFLLATIPISLRIFTQREHFVLVATIPYVLLCGARDRGQRVSMGLATSIAVIAAFGFAIKPFFALVPIALELWLWRHVSRVRTETICLGSLAALYVLATLMLEQDFITAVPMIAASYEHFFGGDYRGFVIPFLLFGLATIPLSKSEQFEAPFVVASLAFLLAFIIQGKAWPYQALPAMGMLLLALTSKRWGKSTVADAIAVCIFGVSLWLNAGVYPTQRSFKFPENSTVAALTFSTLPVWPDVEDRHYVWPLHAFSLWQIGAIDQGLSPAEPLQRRIAHDLRCTPPDFLVVDHGSAVDDFLRGSADLQDFLSHYRLARTKKKLDLYVRIQPLLERPANCRRIA
jgi:hypothetical protein